MSILLEPPKRSSEVRRYRHDWTPFLGEDTIVDETTTADGVTLDSIDIEAGDQSVVFTVSGGDDGTVARIVHSITTAAGDEETEIFVLPLGEDEPVSLSEAKAQVRMAEDDSEDAFIASLIAPARAYVERVGRHYFVPGTRVETFRRWGDYLEIYRRPITAIESVTYSVSDDPEDDVAYEGFAVDFNSYPLRIYPAFGGNGFPTLVAGQTITATLTAGAVSETSEEYHLGKRAMLLLIGHWFENRETAVVGQASNEVDFAVRSLLDELRPISAY